MIKIQKRRAARQPEPNAQMTPEQVAEHRKLYQHQYYLTHKEKQREYQRDYNRKHRKATSGPKALRGRLRKDADREPVRSVHNANSLQAIPLGGKLERELDRILSGKCDYAGTR